MKNLILALISLSFIHCSQSPNPSETKKLHQKALKMSHRPEKNQARDQYRHPIETLEFFEVRPNMTVVEVSPGSGWYTEILAPYLSKGELYLAAFAKDTKVEYFKKANKKLVEKVKSMKGFSGKVYFTEFQLPQKIGPIAPNNAVDRVLTFRNVHNWMKSGMAIESFQEFFRVLKPGGILGVVEHRASEKSKKDPKAESGYVHVSQVMEIAKAAGFEFVESSEINSNPKDTANHPKGVWTLPPRLRLGEKDKNKYLAIGESDRMTLKFRKPKK